jgi:2-oxoglutarate ferredoxin oxidoreductase subunit alpha
MMKKYLMKGNEALAEAAVNAGCKLFFGYPITPSTEIPEYMSKKLVEINGEFVQAESEVAAINMVYGASATGNRVMTASSSPGFSLKQEGLSYLAAAGLPSVIVNVMRAGPGLGGLGPTQADYFQITKGGGHGDYYPISLAPYSVQEIVDLTIEAFDIAEKYRTPVILALDGILGQMMEPVVFPEPQKEKLIKNDWAVGGCLGRKKRNVGSYCLTPEVGEKNCTFWQAKHEEIQKSEQKWDTYRLDDAEFVFVAFGTSARIVESVIDMAREEGIKVGLIRPISLWPFPQKAFVNLSENVKALMCIELSVGQMIQDVKLAVECRLPVEFYGRQGGMMPTPEEVLNVFKEKVVNKYK